MSLKKTPKYRKMPILKRMSIHKNPLNHKRHQQKNNMIIDRLNIIQNMELNNILNQDDHWPLSQNKHFVK